MFVPYVRSAVLAVGCVLASLSMAQRHALSPQDIKIQLNNVQFATDLTPGIGKIIRIHDRHVWLRLSPTTGLKDAMSKLQSRSNVRALEPIKPTLPQTIMEIEDIDELESVIESYEKSFREFVMVTEPHREGEFDLEEAGLDFLQAYLHYNRIRAYPKKTVNWNLLKQVIEQKYKEVQDASETRQPYITSGNWQFIGPKNLSVPYRQYYGNGPINGRVNVMEYAPPPPGGTNPTIYIGAPLGGIWKTTDYGATWSVLSNDWPWQSVGAFDVSPTNSNLLLAGTGDYDGFDWAGFGIMRSTNGGTTWTRIASIFGSERFSNIIFSPDNSNVVLATTTGGLYRSTDAGLTWVRLQTGNFSGLTHDPGIGGTRTYFVCRSTAPSILKSTDQGATWVATTDPIVSPSGKPDIAASKVTNGTVYLLDIQNQKIFKSLDSGTTWTDTTSNFSNQWSQKWYDWHINTSYRTNGPGNVDVVYIGLIDICMSKDAGATWRNMGGSNWTATYNGTAITHNDQHSFAVNPNNPNEVLIGNDGGIYRATYDPVADTVAWTFMSATLGITQFYSIATHPTLADYVMGGTQDNASPHSFGNLNSWGNPGAGDGTGAAINQSNPNNQYTAWQFQNLYRTDNAWTNRTNITPSWSGHTVPFIGNMWLDPNNNRYLYLDTNYLNRYDAQTNTWSLKVGNKEFGGVFYGFAVSKGDSNTLYVGARNGIVWRSPDFGVTWVDISGTSLPNAIISDVSVNPSNKNDVLVSFYGSGITHLYRCTNAAAATPVWTAVAGSGPTALPDVATNSIARDIYAPQTTWYVATDVGVYVTTDAGATWTDMTYSKGMPIVQVSALSAQAGTQYLTAATYGRGMYRIGLVPPVVNLTSLLFIPTFAREGDSTPGTLTIDTFAPINGTTASLTSNNPSFVTPSNVTVAEATKTVTFNSVVGQVNSPQLVTVTANHNGSIVTGQIQILPPNWTYTTPHKLDYSSVTPQSGSLANLSQSDNVALIMNLLGTGVGRGSMFFTSTLPILNPSKSVIEAEFAAGTAGLPVRISAYDYVSGSFETVWNGVTDTTDQTFYIRPTNPARFVGPGGLAQLLIVATNGTGVNQPFMIDMLKWGEIP